MLPGARSARSPTLRVVPVIFSPMKASATVEARARSRKSGHDTSDVPVDPLSVPASATMRSWRSTPGNGRSRMPSIHPKTAAFAPMPSVRQRIARIENPGGDHRAPRGSANPPPSRSVRSRHGSAARQPWGLSEDGLHGGGEQRPLAALGVGAAPAGSSEAVVLARPARVALAPARRDEPATLHLMERRIDGTHLNGK